MLLAVCPKLPQAATTFPRTDSKMPIRKKRRRKTIVVQSGLAKIYPESYTKRVGGRRRRYQRFTVSHYRVEGKKRTRYRKSFSSLEDARFEAERVATAIANGEGDVLKLTSTDRASYLHAIARLEPIGIPLHAAIEEYITAREHAGAGLIAAAKEFAQRHSTVALRKPVAEVVKEFLAAKEQDGMSVRYLQSLRSHLNRFADQFGLNISTVTTALIETWLRSAKRGARTRNNIRLSIVTLFNFAKDRGYLSKSLETEADQLAKAKDRGGKIGRLLPEQLAGLLKSVGEEAKLYLSLGAFTGLRSAELIRLEWQDVNFARGHIEVGKDKAKTATRRLVPIQANLETWLAPYRDCRGLVFSSENAADRTIAFAKADADFRRVEEIKWPPNALRHSYATYRMAQCYDAARVALEMGNSPQMLFRNYLELADAKDAADWFSIVRPEAAGNVVAFQASG
jgi:integrase